MTKGLWPYLLSGLLVLVGLVVPRLLGKSTGAGALANYTVSGRRPVPVRSQAIHSLDSIAAADDLPLYVGQQTCSRCGRHEPFSTLSRHRRERGVEYMERQCRLCSFVWLERTKAMNPPLAMDTRKSETTVTEGQGGAMGIGSKRVPHEGPCAACNSALHRAEDCNMGEWYFPKEL